MWQFRRGQIAGRMALDAGVAAAPFALTPISGSNLSDNTTTATYTFSSITLPAGAVVAVFGARNSGGTQLATGVTIGGQTATKIVGSVQATTCSIEAWYATGVSAGSGSIVVTCAGANSRMGLMAYGVDSFNASAITSSIITGSVGGAGNAITATRTIPSGGASIVALFSIAGFPGAPSATPAGLNNLDANLAISGTQGFASFHAAAGALSGSTAETISLTVMGSSSATIFVELGP